MELVYLNVGSNIDRHAHICRGLDALQQRFGDLQLSSVFESEALGFSGEPFYNLALVLRTDVPLVDLARWLRQLEYTSGRQRGASRFSPRTLDIDILLYGDLHGEITGIELPRPEILENAHVLAPLAELAPDMIHPLVGQSYAHLWADFYSPDNVWPVDFCWGELEISRSA